MTPDWSHKALEHGNVAILSSLKWNMVHKFLVKLTDSEESPQLSSTGRSPYSQSQSSVNTGCLVKLSDTRRITTALQQVKVSVQSRVEVNMVHKMLGETVGHSKNRKSSPE